MATPSQPLSVVALRQQLLDAASRATGAAQSAQSAAQRLQATGTAFAPAVISSPVPAPAAAPAKP